MLPGLPPRDKSFKGWLFPLVVPTAAFVLVVCFTMSAACLFGDSVVTISGTRYTGFAAVRADRVGCSVGVCGPFAVRHHDPLARFSDERKVVSHQKENAAP